MMINAYSTNPCPSSFRNIWRKLWSIYLPYLPYLPFVVFRQPIKGQGLSPVSPVYGPANHLFTFFGNILVKYYSFILLLTIHLSNIMPHSLKHDDQGRYLYLSILINFILPPPKRRHTQSSGWEKFFLTIVRILKCWEKLFPMPCQNNFR